MLRIPCGVIRFDFLYKRRELREVVGKMLPSELPVIRKQAGRFGIDKNCETRKCVREMWESAVGIRVLPLEPLGNMAVQRINVDRGAHAPFTPIEPPILQGTVKKPKTTKRCRRRRPQVEWELGATDGVFWVC
jgi:hypothetical protein